MALASNLKIKIVSLLDSKIIQIALGGWVMKIDGRVGRDKSDSQTCFFKLKKVVE